jgi:hypothetical protein
MVTMDFTVSFEPGRVVVETSGVAARGGFTRFIDSIVEDPRFRPGMPVLVDHSKLDMDGLTTADMQAVADAVLHRNARIGRSLVAIVTPASVAYGLTRQFTAFADLADIRVRIFGSRAEADDWLTGARAA